MRLHHVQLAMPTGQEPEARRFYADTLGLVEVAKPQELAGRGGCWFRSSEGEVVTVEIHLGVEEPFAPAKKAHPALLVRDSSALEELGTRIEAAGYDVDWAERASFLGFERFHCRDGFGNRVEVMTPTA